MEEKKYKKTDKKHIYLEIITQKMTKILNHAKKNILNFSITAVILMITIPLKERFFFFLEIMSLKYGLMCILITFSMIFFGINVISKKVKIYMPQYLILLFNFAAIFCFSVFIFFILSIFSCFLIGGFSCYYFMYLIHYSWISVYFISVFLYLRPLLDHLDIDFESILEQYRCYIKNLVQKRYKELIIFFLIISITYCLLFPPIYNRAACTYFMYVKISPEISFNCKKIADYYFEDGYSYIYFKFEKKNKNNNEDRDLSLSLRIDFYDYTKLDREIIGDSRKMTKNSKIIVELYHLGDGKYMYKEIEIEIEGNFDGSEKKFDLGDIPDGSYCIIKTELGKKPLPTNYKDLTINRYVFFQTLGGEKDIPPPSYFEEDLTVSADFSHESYITECFVKDGCSEKKIYPHKFWYKINPDTESIQYEATTIPDYSSISLKYTKLAFLFSLCIYWFSLFFRRKGDKKK